MPEFKLPNLVKIAREYVKVSRKLVPVIVYFRVADEARNTMSIEDLCEHECDLLMNFYILPANGEHIIYSDCKWLISDLTHYPSRRNSKDARLIPTLKATLVDFGNIDQSLDYPSATQE